MSNELKVAGEIKPAEKCNYIEYPPITGRSSGSMANVSANLATGLLTKWALIGKLKKNIGISDLMKLTIQDEPLYDVSKIYATDEKSDALKNLYDEIEKLINIEETIKPYSTLRDFYLAYREKKVTPSEICEKIIEATKTDEIKNLNAILEMHEDEIRLAAEESTKRVNDDKPLSPIDGIPFFIKDVVDAKGYTSNQGLAHVITKPSQESSSVLEKLVSAGAILMGINNMTYGGLNVIGFNPSKKHGTVRNPYNLEYYCGGSSNGSCAVVSAGLVPFSIGSDGLGSNRIPPAFTGLTGLRSTMYRIGNGNCCHESSSSILLGPITASVKDNAIIYGIIAGADEKHTKSLYQPPVTLPTFTSDIKTLASTIKIGYDPSYNDLVVDEAIKESVKNTIENLKSAGFTIVEYCIPEIYEIISSTKAMFIKDVTTHMTEKFGPNCTTKGVDCANARIIFSIGKSITDDEYIQCLRQRNRAQHILKDMFNKFDIFISPATGILPQKILDGDEVCGVLDDVATQRISMYSALSSFCGNPSMVVHTDTTSDNLPVGTQLQASWWKEDILYEIAHVIESFLPSEKRNPKTFISPL